MFPSASSNQRSVVAWPMDLSRTVLIVVGACPRAEVEDRPTAYALRERLESEMALRLGPGRGGWSVLVLSDVWVMNQEELRECPTICLGGPGNCALSAALVGRLPEVFSVDDALAVHADLEGGAAIAVCWGVDGAATRRAVDEFCRRGLERFVEAVASMA